MLELKDVNKAYDAQAFIRDFSLELAEGEILSLLGPSGCGKTTLLRLIAGLETPDSGLIAFDGQDLSGVKPHQRRFGLMFQEYALFPHRNVFENVAFGLEMQRLPKAQIESRTRTMLALVGLEALAGRGVAELSGGERQRVALARSLAPGPRLLMLDEPFAALDRQLKDRLSLELREILRRLKVSTIFVTHDQAEAFALADQVAVVMDGRLEQVARPEVLSARPPTPGVARFLGYSNLLEGCMLADGDVRTALDTFKTNQARLAPGTKVTVLIRPAGAYVMGPGQPPAINMVEGRLTATVFRGAYHEIRLTTATGQVLSFELRNGRAPREGQHLQLGLAPEELTLIPG